MSRAIYFIDNDILALVDEETGETEIWKDIPNYEGYYQASSLGRIKSLERKVKSSIRHNEFITRKEKMLQQGFSKHTGYYSVTLSKQAKKETFTVHRLIAITFFGQSRK